MDGELKKEQIDTLFVRVGLLQGGFCGLGGWFRGGPTHFLRGVPLLFFCPPGRDLIYMYLSTPAHSACGGRCPGGQGRNPCQKMVFQKLLPSTINLPGVFAIVLGTFW